MQPRSLLVVLSMWLGCDAPPPTADPKPPPAPPRIPPALQASADEVLAACRHRDVQRLWLVLSPDLKRRLDARAWEERRQGAPHLRSRYRYDDHPGGFDGTAFLQAMLKGSPEQHPCPNADLWRRVDASADDATAKIAYEHPDGRQQVLLLEREPTSQRWVLSSFAAQPDDASP